ncbi:antibiotic biosynthesis monooxygenase [Alteriqipengyuania sp. NZ-12B]|uniref:Antibiotic biosynthesis monooxygenase n=1 Tax=Alteriqipengyuania abyssalis TaxID=2860200 RepID=A0ABS7PCZ6_9SPHN|nr:antibiotic biosynthesis monooxygenase [Alteriqipengyuania abyssalis]MBY8336914.1 antibiotic biosynthesis monooxygenase [Alteriqipengyuania abyssalis]
MYLVVFRSRKRAGYDAAAYAEHADAMEALAREQPGFLAVKTYAADDGETVTISEWATREAAKAWRCHPDHAGVQDAGRTHHYAGYTMFTCLDPQVTHYQHDEPDEEDA